MMEELLGWFAPGQRELVAKLISMLVERIEQLEARVAALEQK